MSIFHKARVKKGTVEEDGKGGRTERKDRASST